MCKTREILVPRCLTNGFSGIKNASDNQEIIGDIWHMFNDEL